MAVRAVHPIRSRGVPTRVTPALLVVALLAGSGCNSTAKHDHPVFGPSPKRLTLDEVDTAGNLAEAENSGAASADATGVQLASSTEAPVDSSADIYSAKVVARVDGAPVFAGEVLDRYGEYLAKVRPQMTPEQFQQVREALVQRDLRGHIERRLLAERMRAKMKPDQIKQIEDILDKMFEKEVDKLKRELKVNSRTELELALQERGSSLSAVREGFIAQQMAMEYLRSKVVQPPIPSRGELVAYYQEHAADYDRPEEVRWEHLQFGFAESQGRLGAQEKGRKALAALDAGQDFAAVAKEYSDGPTASRGGQWTWTKRGSLVDKKLEELLFSQPDGELSPLTEGKGCFHVVRVLERHKAGRVPFEDVQEEIVKAIQQQHIDGSPKQVMQELIESAVIETEYDVGLKPKVADAPAPAARK